MLRIKETAMINNRSQDPDYLNKMTIYPTLFRNLKKISLILKEPNNNHLHKSTNFPTCNTQKKILSTTFPGLSKNMNKFCHPILCGTNKMICKIKIYPKINFIKPNLNISSLKLKSLFPRMSPKLLHLLNLKMNGEKKKIFSLQQKHRKKQLKKINFLFLQTIFSPNSIEYKKKKILM